MFLNIMKKKYIDWGNSISSCNYACRYMGIRGKGVSEKAKVKPRVYVRYIDDVFGIWIGTMEELYEYHRLANNKKGCVIGIFSPWRY